MRADRHGRGWSRDFAAEFELCSVDSMPLGSAGLSLTHHEIKRGDMRRHGPVQAVEVLMRPSLCRTSSGVGVIVACLLARSLDA